MRVSTLRRRTSPAFIHAIASRSVAAVLRSVDAHAAYNIALRSSTGYEPSVGADPKLNRTLYQQALQLEKEKVLLECAAGREAVVVTRCTCSRAA